MLSSCRTFLFQEFVKALKMRPLSRHYFVIQTNPGEQVRSGMISNISLITDLFQFYLFTSLAAWLSRKCGQQFEQPQEFDDPNSTISNVLDALRKVGVSVDFAPSKLKQVTNCVPA